jgi:chemotaxis protein MotB
VKADKETIDAKLSDLARLAEQNTALTALRDDLEKQVKTAVAAALTEEQRRRAVEAQLQDQNAPADSARARIALLTQQVAQLRSELAASEQNRSEAQSREAGLTAQLNLALAAQVEELRKYRSDFFGKLRAVLAGRPGIAIVGDRFVFQSEVLFGIGSAELTPAGVAQMTDLASTLRDIAEKIPADLNWVLRVDGHTDAAPVHNARFASNWELSAARAIAVVKFLVAHGIPASHLAATGFGENQPVDTAGTPDANAKNRRIEIRLTDR